MDRAAAARFSFMLSIPAIGGAFLLKFDEVVMAGTDPLPLVIGFITAAGSGFLALRLLLRIVTTGDFSRFAWYLWPLAAVSIGMALFG
jgi:undecaprenyl-diphosphatase